MKSLQKIYILIQLMAVTTTTYAIPTDIFSIYPDYVSKSQVMRVYGEMSAAKTAIDAALFEGLQPVLGKVDESDHTKENIGLTKDKKPLAAGTQSTRIHSLLISKMNLSVRTGAAITQPAKAQEWTLVATLGKEANMNIAGAMLQLDRDEEGIWTCTVKKGGATHFKAKYVPSNCSFVK